MQILHDGLDGDIIQRIDRAERERKGDALDAFLFELSELDELDMEFSPQRWNAIVDHVTVHHDGRIIFSFQNGSEVTVII